MPWKGYNYEDAIVISERMIRWDILTSVHVDEYITEVRDTKRGMEELTSDIPNVSEEATKDLDENGIIRVGAHIEPGDIMIGKITPKGESDPSPRFVSRTSVMYSSTWIDVRMSQRIMRSEITIASS